MPYKRQNSLTVVAPVRAGAEAELEALLASMGDGVANGSVVDFGALDDVHFARLFVAPADHGLPASLVLLSDFDGSVDAHLQQLATTQAAGIDRVFAHCDGWSGDRLGYLRRHRVKEAARYVNTPGRTVRQIQGEAALRDAIESYLDASERNGGTPADVHRAVRDRIATDAALAWALEPAERPGLGDRVRDVLHLVAIPLLTLPFLPLILLAAPFFVVILRIHERRDPAPDVVPPDELVQSLAALEDHVVQNPFTAMGHVKPGLFRLVTLRMILFYLNWAARHFFARGSLSGVKSIHFARWVFIDGKQRVFFASNYDGSLESYMDDFIDKVAWGLNLVFSNGVGYPRTSWLVKGGAKDELAFKDYLRTHQVPTRVWFSAYPQLTALNVGQNERIRAGLRGGDERAWVQSL